jgi:ABC-2 type transport system ATP-binding protein
VEIQDLVVRYPRAARNALDYLSLTVQSGSFFGLLGPNGAGKTTLISFLCGQVDGQYAQARVLGIERGEISRYKRALGYAPQEVALYPTLSVLQNLRFFAKLQDVAVTEVDRVLDWIGLRERAQDAVNELSGGMKRRLNLGVALLNKPRLLILDEPTAGVDPQSRNFIFERILELKRSGVTLIYSTHYFEEVKRLCDTVAIVNGGRLSAHGSRDEVLGEDMERRFLDIVTGAQA